MTYVKFNRTILFLLFFFFHNHIQSQSSFDFELQTGYSSSWFDITNRSRVNLVHRASIYTQRMERLSQSTYLIGIGYRLKQRHRFSLTYRIHTIGSMVSPLDSNSISIDMERTKLFEIGFRYDYKPIKSISIRIGPILNILDRFDATGGFYGDNGVIINTIRSSTLPFDKSIFKAMEFDSYRLGYKIGVAYLLDIDHKLSLFISGDYLHAGDYISSPGISSFPYGTFNEYIFSLGLQYSFYQLKGKKSEHKEPKRRQ